MGVGIPEQSPIYLYDFDMFEAHNVANQWADVGDVGGWKAERVARSMRCVNIGCEVTPHMVEVNEFMPLSGVVFICVDSMKARRSIMENVVEKNPDVACVIETRMDAETGISHCFDPHDKRQSDCWWLYWHSDNEADNIGGCSQPQSIISAIYGTTMLALKQLEQFTRIGHTYEMANRVYQDYTTFSSTSEQWPHLTGE
jgi:molybdopterin/thiamine biosynthesis adenylyltransferase